ncbi:SpoIIE family protein phosphatase [Trichothermofontia sichuanensis B231]|uniref:SpoIIE family protein phosphatase n=1 Tax=Trichothermofontia sichuanensis TaxID=3045816 RepID=UPI0022458DDD|nr:SpoIIE family protein phosphatase [Trichothermofontia sichuanensis]UZQ53856.1 SpoIIE family protein phosphatase [Trichothermofontia sichuanensis B231]
MALPRLALNKAPAAAVATGATVLLATGLLAQANQQRFQAAVRANVLNQASTIRAQLEGYINSQLLLAEALAAYTATNPQVTQAEFAAIARLLRQKNPGIRSMNLAKDTIISHIYPLEGNEAALGLNLAATPQQKAAVERAIREKRAVVAGPVNLVQGGVAFINRTPIFIPTPTGEIYWGQASVLVNAAAVYAVGGLDNPDSPLAVALRGKDGLGAAGEGFWGDASIFAQNPVLLAVTLPNGSWQMAVIPRHGWTKTAPTTVWIWLGGSAIALLAGGGMFLLASEPERLRLAIAQATAHLEATLAKLQQEMADREQAEAALRDSQVRLARTQAELDVTRRLQQLLLPQPAELAAIKALDIAGFMEPAAAVGGDYYDVLQQDDHVKIGIGDITGHGLESGMLMVMVQMAVRTLLASREPDLTRFLSVINQAIYDNVQRMQVYKNLTLTLLDYHNGQIRLTGQHEEVILVRADGRLERINTIDLGFPLGLEADISPFLAEVHLQLNRDDVLILYTDGIPEAENDQHQFYGLDRLCQVAVAQRSRAAADICAAIVADVHQHIGEHRVYDDLTLLVLKQR